MTVRRSGVFWSLACAIVAVVCFAPDASAFGQDTAAQDSGQEQSALPQILQSAAESLDISAGEQGDTLWTLQATPLMTYSDPARDFSASGVWRIGESGRPQGLVAIEFRPNAVNGRDFLSYELLSFSNVQLQFSSATGIDVQLSENAIDMQVASDAVLPSDTMRLRLLQMKQIAARFQVHETYRDKTYALRLLPRPIDRYEDLENNIIDAAAFVFVYGTNPELLLLVECSAAECHYGLARMSSARLRVMLDDNEVADYPALSQPYPTRDYQSANHTIRQQTETN